MARKRNVSVWQMNLLQLAVLRVVRETQLQRKSTNDEIVKRLNGDSKLSVGNAHIQRSLMALCGQDMLSVDATRHYQLTEQGREALRMAALFIAH